MRVLLLLLRFLKHFALLGFWIEFFIFEFALYFFLILAGVVHRVRLSGLKFNEEIL